MSVTVTSPGIETDFITFEPETRVVSWVATNNAKSGTYTITITGTINASSIWTKSISFLLIVTYNCRYSPETIQINAGAAQSN
jgi:hypothetical protein